MPRTKRDKKISLTKTKKKGLDAKRELIEAVHKCCDSYENLFVFDVENMRNSKLKEWRRDWKSDSRIFLGKNNVMAIAFGRRPEDEYKDGLHKVSKLLTGNVGILFSNKPKDEVISFCQEFSSPDYAHSGFIALHSVVISPGPLNQFSHALQPHLQQLGLHCVLKKGIITLENEFTVCKQNKPLTPEQARILKLFGHQMAHFKIHLSAVWSNDGSFDMLKSREQKVVPKKIVLTGDVNAMEADSLLDVDDDDVIDDGKSKSNLMDADSDCVVESD